MAGIRKGANVHVLAVLAGLAIMGNAHAVSPPEASNVAAAPTPFLGGFLEESRVVYPLEMAGWTAGDEHRYDDQASGVSVGYARGEGTPGVLTVYFYPAGVLSPDAFTDAAAAVWEGIAEARRGDGGSAAMGDLEPYASPSRPGAPGYIGSLSFENEHGAYHSAMALLLDRLYFVKARLSIDAREASLAETGETLRRIMDALEARLVISSTGACWHVDPLDIPGAGAVSGPDGHLAGCDGEAPSNPEVGEGMREIRFEYRALPTAGAEPPRRPRAKTGKSR